MLHSFSKKKVKKEKKTHINHENTAPQLSSHTGMESTSLSASEKENMPLNKVVNGVETSAPQTEKVTLEDWEIMLMQDFALPEIDQKTKGEVEDAFLEDWEREDFAVDFSRKFKIEAKDTSDRLSAEPMEMQCLPSFSKSIKSAKEVLNIKLFKELSKLNPKKQQRPGLRMNQFVITLGAPDLPRRHSGVDDSYHPDRDIDVTWKDLLMRGMTTLKYVNHHNRAKRPCTNLIFLRSPIQNDDPLSTEIHTGHTLDFFQSSIVAEKQLPIEFHFAGHGNLEEIGAMSGRFPPDIVADLFCHIAAASGLDEILKSKTAGLIFNFHVCNSGYVDVTDCETDAEIQDKILNESVIGKFYNAMIANEYTNITVIGYRGFYQGLENGADSTVTDTIEESGLSLPIEKVKHCITRVGDDNIVTLPDSDKHKRFEVDFKTVQSRLHI